MVVAYIEYTKHMTRANKIDTHILYVKCEFSS